MRFLDKSLVSQHSYASRNTGWQMSVWTMSTYSLDILEGPTKHTMYLNALGGCTFQGFDRYVWHSSRLPLSHAMVNLSFKMIA